ESSALPLAAPAAPDVVQRQPETGPSSAPTPPITGSPEISVPAVQSGPFEETTPSSVPTEPPARVVQKEKAAAVPAALPLVAPIAPAVIQRRLEAIPPGTPVPSDTLVSSDLPVSGVSVPAVLQQLEQETLPTQVVGSPSGTGTGDLFLPSVSPQRPGMAVTVMDQLVQRQSVQEQSPPLALHSDVSPKSVIQTRSVERTTILPLAQIQRQTEREQRVRPGVRPSPLSRFSSEVQAEPLPVAAGVTAPSITQGVRFDAGLSSSLEASERLPLPLTSTPPFAGAIQRQIKDVPISSFESSDTANAIQRVETTSLEMGAAPEEQAGPDLDRLAKEVYPRIKRMLAVERERRTCRWR
ncbi:MAG: hypothetical protein JW934_24850, partial [Anaerolineae bacterium]|nr:hypothetical protein [Anaerolineae bacterium]